MYIYIRACIYVYITYILYIVYFVHMPYTSNPEPLNCTQTTFQELAPLPYYGV